MDDLETADALAMVQAHATRNHALLAAMLATMDAAELRRTVNRMCALVDLRGRIGTDQPDTATWCRWLRSNEGFVL